MKRKYFGTDGVRGRANIHPMTAEMALKLGAVVGQYFASHKGSKRVIIGKDTRRSGYMIENALTAGLLGVGMDAYLLGPVPTPAVGMLTRSMRADLGIMISASHNPHQDNGIKFFGPDGFKLSDEVEHEIEALLDVEPELVNAVEIGRAHRVEGDRARYIEYAKTTFPRRFRLEGLKVVVDCANGAAYRTAPEVLWELGAEVVPIGVSPNGYNINDQCGSTSPEMVQRVVVEQGADLGICLDGDADRLLVIDEKGEVADGDQLMALIATRMAAEGKLVDNTLVATVMSNLGLERYMEGAGMRLLRTDVGDRYVVEAMRAGGYNLGGEQSGHIVLRDFVTTGDGLIAALQILKAMVETGEKASVLTRVFDPVPQLLKNVRYNPATTPLESVSVQAAIKAGEARFGDEGRVLTRKSGTEALIRVMGECSDAALLHAVVDDIAAAVKAAG
ncbi:MAG: phosphoglucosamine mutase [Rhodobacteraceae bacterium]|nr:phosphoglucosamine mutase [Paracoccaceae bacterium]